MRVIVEGLSKTYRDGSGQDVVALDGIGLTVEPEEFVAILGPSGCGKSTLLNIVGGLLGATSGEVVFEGGASLVSRSPPPCSRSSPSFHGGRRGATWSSASRSFA